MAINLLLSDTQAVNRLTVIDKDFKVHVHQLLSGEMDKYQKEDNWIIVIQ